MIQVQTKLIINDNSGARVAQCIKVLGGSFKKTGSVGDIIVVAVKKAVSQRKVKKSDVHLAVITQTKKPIVRKSGQTISFDQNAAVIITKTNLPVGTRVLGPVTHELRKKKFMKIISLAPKLL